MGGAKQQQTPRALIHKRILDAAAARPNAALAEIANDIPAASTNLVERVLDEYGDPAAEDTSHTASDQPEKLGQEKPKIPEPHPNGEVNQAPTADGISPQESATPSDSVVTDETTAKDTPATEDDRHEDTESGAAEPNQTTCTPTEGTETTGQPVDLDTLTEKRRETLRAINAYPEASQRELAELLGVAAATISQRVNAIDGFEWRNRAKFVVGLFEETQAEFDAESGLAESPDNAATEPPPQDDGNAADTPQPTATEMYETAMDGGRHVSDRQGVALEERVAALESTLDEHTTCPRLGNPELTAKVIHACLDADSISTDEELEIIERFLA